MSAARPSTRSPVAAWWTRFWFPAVPAARFEIFRRLLYGYLLLDVLVTTTWVRDHGSADAGLYQPLLIGRLLPLPVPTDVVVTATMWTVLVGAVIGLAGRSPRLVGAITACAYLQWMVIAFSYGKVNHDRFPLLVALFVAVTVGRTSIRDRTPSVAAGWALQMTMVATVAVYFLSVLAKVRYGGWLWANSATLTQALLRRGTFIGRELRDLPQLAVLAQWAAVALELVSPVLLVRHRIRWVLWGTAIGFHVVTFAVLSIGFYPQLLCLLAFLPLERLAPAPQDRGSGGPAAVGHPAAAREQGGVLASSEASASRGDCSTPQPELGAGREKIGSDALPRSGSEEVHVHGNPHRRFAIMETAPETMASPAQPADTDRGIGNEFRSVIEATTMERRAEARARRADRSLAPSHRTHDVHPTESETWRLAI